VVATAVLAATAACMFPFTYYDNGSFVTVPLAVVYAREISGYGRKGDPERRLPPEWGSWLGYSARNFTLDLFGLDYSHPLAWEDSACGPGLVVFSLRDSTDRTPVAVYPMGPTNTGRRTLVVSEVRSSGSGADAREISVEKYRLELYRPPLASATYVISVKPLDEGWDPARR
jgi:hypothetical protein